MDCAQFKSLISDALDGSLDPEQGRAFELHRKECRSCEREFIKQRRIKLCLRSFPTVREVDEGFRRELVARLRRSALPRSYRLRLPAVAATLAVICLLLIGVLFGIKTYHQYLYREEIFIARFEPRSYEAGTFEPGADRVRIPSVAATDGPVYVLNLSQLRPEEFVIRLLAKYQRGEVPEGLARRLLVDTGVLEGVRLRWLERGSFQQLTGQPLQAEVIFPHPLPDALTTTLSSSELLALRRFAMDVVYAFGIYVPQLEADRGGRARSSVPEKLQSADLIDLLSASFRDEDVGSDGSLVTLVLFSGSPVAPPAEDKARAQ